jgi:hypothetical protein
MSNSLKDFLKKYLFFVFPLFFLACFFGVNTLQLNACENGQNSTFKIFDKGYIKYKHSRMQGDNLIIDGAGQFNVICTQELFKITPKNSDQKFSFDGKAVNTLYGVVYSNDTKRMGVSVIFKNPIVYFSNVFLIIFLTLYLIKYNVTFSKYINYSLLPLLGVAYYLELDTSLSSLLPSILRILTFSMVMSKILLFNDSWKKILEHKNTIILFSVFILIIFYKQDLSLSMHPAFGRHWFYLLDSVIQNASMSLGSINSNGLFYDALVYKNNGFMPNNIGPILFAFFFGSELFKLGIFIISLVTALNYMDVYKSLVEKCTYEKNKILILILLLMIVSPAIILSGTYYPIPQIGSAFFLSLGFISLVRENKLTNTNLVFFSVATLFRIESILVLFLAGLFYFSKIKKILFYAGLSALIFLASNYIKFDDFLQSGIGYNHNINDPKFKPLSITYLYNNLYGYFIRLPNIYHEYKILFLKFEFNGSEPGGYFFLKYPLVLAALYFITKKINILKFDALNLLILFSGLAILFFYLLGFNTSPKYDVMYAPLILLTLVSYPIGNIFLRFFIIAFIMAVHGSILMNLIVAYPFYK